MTSHSISQFLILSLRGDKIIYKDCKLKKFHLTLDRNDIAPGAEEIFFRRTKLDKTDVPPCFTEQGITFIHIKRNTLYFVFTTRFNISSSLVLELLEKITVVLRDFIGYESEDSYRKNFLLIYEILDEVVDFGNVQTTNGLKYYVINEPIEENTSEGILNSLPLNIMKQKTKSSLAVHRSVHSRKSNNNEIFVDVIETVNCVLGNSGSVIRADITGQIIMKSFLLGQPALALALNDNLIVGRGNTGQSGVCVIDSCNFSDLCQLNEWEHQKVINLSPPEGEFTVMTYRIVSPYNMPFRIFPAVALVSKFKVEAVFKVRSMYPSEVSGSKVFVKIPLPKQTNNVSVEFEKGKTNTYEYNSQQKFVMWEIGSLMGNIEQIIKISISLNETIVGDVKKHVGPVSMSFEVPSMNASELRIKFLKHNHGFDISQILEATCVACNE